MTYLSKAKLSKTRLTLILLVLLAIQLVFSSGCMNTKSDSDTRTREETATSGLADISGRYPGYNIIIISIDTLRADHLGTYGYKRNTSPTVDSIARESIVFENAFAVRGLTWPSLTSMLTSLYPISTNVRENGQLLNDTFITLPEILKEYNYTSAAFLANFCKAGRYGFDSRACTKGDDVRITKGALGWLDKNYDRKFFLWIHYMNPHSPYTPPEKYASLFVDSEYAGYTRNYTGNQSFLMSITLNKTRLTPGDLNYIVSLYDGEVRSTDDQVRQIYQKLDTLGLLDNSIIIITADHGEELYQHNYYFFHGCSVYDSVLHIPLIIRLPDKAISGERVGAVVSNVDIAPTLLDLANISSPHFFEGRSLVQAVLTPEGWENIALSEWGEDIKAIRTPEWKYIYNPENIRPVCVGNITVELEREELYNTATDPNETINVVSRYPGAAASLKKELMDRYKPNKLLNETGAPIEADEETKERLRALGYLA